jgi:hypothetical protein
MFCSVLRSRSRKEPHLLVRAGTVTRCGSGSDNVSIHRQTLDRQTLDRQTLDIQTLDTTNPGQDKPWTGQTLDTTNPRQDKPWTSISADIVTKA